MDNHFPYEGPSDLDGDLTSAEDLAEAHLRVERLLLNMVRPDSAVALIAHFDGSLEGHLGQAGSGTGAIRYWQGRFDNSNGVLVESAGENLLPNPSAETDITGWSANDPAVEITRSPSVAYTGDGTVSQASFRLGGTSKAGPGYVKTSVSVEQEEDYSAAVYVYSEETAKARLEMAFTGGTPATHTSSDVTLTAGAWTRLKLEAKNSDDNTTLQLRVYLVQQAPEFNADSRFSKLTPNSTALTSTTLNLTTGDAVMGALTDSPDGPESYSWHMVTTGGIGSAIRLDDEEAAPVFVEGSRVSKWTPNDTVTDEDNVTTLNQGDLLLCQLVGEEDFAWHVVTTAGTAASGALRLDDSPAAPLFESVQISRFVPNATALADDAAMVIGAGDLAFCFTLSNPQDTPGYAWRMVTTGTTGVSSSSLRLNGSAGAPEFASGSRFSRLTAASTALVTDGGLAITAGDFAFCSPSKNPAGGSSYGWHLATTGATGVSSSDLRLDQCSSQVIYADAAQVEEEERVSSYIDERQGTGFAGSSGSVKTRAASRLSFPRPTAMDGGAGTVAFWFQPLWAGDDGQEHVLFDAAQSSNQNRLRLSKNQDNKLVLSVYDAEAELKQVVSTSTVSFSAETWQHAAFTYSSGTLKIYLNGTELATSTVGLGTGVMDPAPATMHLGNDFQNILPSYGAVFDDLVVYEDALSAQRLSAMASANSAFTGLALSQSSFPAASGSSVTHSSAGTQTSVAHGLGVIPSFVLITERGNGVVYLSAPSDSTSFYVTASASSITFDWRAYA